MGRGLPIDQLGRHYFFFAVFFFAAFFFAGMPITPFCYLGYFYTGTKGFICQEKLFASNPGI